MGGIEESVIKNKSCYFISSENPVKSSNKIKEFINKKNFFLVIKLIYGNQNLKVFT